MKRSFNDSEPNQVPTKVCLVERNTSPGGFPLVNAVKVAKRSSNDLVSLANEIETADAFMAATTCNKLQVIVQQVRNLQQKYQEILKEAKFNAALHHVACNFVKNPGNIYHLYERQTGQKYFSMLSPEEWNSPHTFHGSFRLELDHSWTNIENICAKDDEQRQINHLSKMYDNPLCLPEAPMDL